MKENFTLCDINNFFTNGVYLPKVLVAIMFLKNFLFLDCLIFGVPQTSPSKGKKLTDAVVNSFLLNIDTYLKLSMQRILKEMFCSQTVTLDLSQTSISRNVRIRVCNSVCYFKFKFIYFYLFITKLFSQKDIKKKERVRVL